MVASDCDCNVTLYRIDQATLSRGMPSALQASLCSFSKISVRSRTVLRGCISIRLPTHGNRMN